MLVTYGILEKVTKILIVKIKIAGLLCRYSENQADLKQKDTITKQVNGQKSWQKPPIILQSGNRINIVIRKDIAGRVKEQNECWVPELEHPYAHFPGKVFLPNLHLTD